MKLIDSDFLIYVPVHRNIIWPSGAIHMCMLRMFWNHVTKSCNMEWNLLIDN